jgi:hypothetical protein
MAITFYAQSIHAFHSLTLCRQTGKKLLKSPGNHAAALAAARRGGLQWKQSGPPARSET